MTTATMLLCYYATTLLHYYYTTTTLLLMVKLLVSRFLTYIIYGVGGPPVTTIYMFCFLCLGGWLLLVSYLLVTLWGASPITTLLYVAVLFYGVVISR